MESEIDVIREYWAWRTECDVPQNRNIWDWIDQASQKQLKTAYEKLLPLATVEKLLGISIDYHHTQELVRVIRGRIHGE